MHWRPQFAHWMAREQDSIELALYATVILAAAIWWASLYGGGVSRW